MMKFVEMTLKDKNRKKYVDSFYEFLCMRLMKDYLFEESKKWLPAGSHFLDY